MLVNEITTFIAFSFYVLMFSVEHAYAVYFLFAGVWDQFLSSNKSNLLV